MAWAISRYRGWGSEGHGSNEGSEFDLLVIRLGVVGVRREIHTAVMKCIFGEFLNVGIELEGRVSRMNDEFGYPNIYPKGRRGRVYICTPGASMSLGSIRKSRNPVRHLTAL